MQVVPEYAGKGCRLFQSVQGILEFVDCSIVGKQWVRAVQSRQALVSGCSRVCKR